MELRPQGSLMAGRAGGEGLERQLLDFLALSVSGGFPGHSAPPSSTPPCVGESGGVSRGKRAESGRRDRVRNILMLRLCALLHGLIAGTTEAAAFKSVSPMIQPRPCIGPAAVNDSPAAQYQLKIECLGQRHAAVMLAAERNGRNNLA